MRRLSAKQKKIIENHVKLYGVRNINQLVSECEKLNDYETLWCDVERYATDYYCDMEYKRINDNYTFTSADFKR